LTSVKIATPHNSELGGEPHLPHTAPAALHWRCNKLRERALASLWEFDRNGQAIRTQNPVKYELTFNLNKILLNTLKIHTNNYAIKLLTLPTAALHFKC